MYKDMVLTPLENLVIQYVQLADELAGLRGKYYESDGQTRKPSLSIEPDTFHLLEKRLETIIELKLAEIRIHAHAYYPFENKD